MKILKLDVILNRNYNDNAYTNLVFQSYNPTCWSPYMDQAALGVKASAKSLMTKFSFRSLLFLQFYRNYACIFSHLDAGPNDLMTIGICLCAPLAVDILIQMLTPLNFLSEFCEIYFDVEVPRAEQKQF